MDQPLESLPDSSLKWHILAKLLLGAIDAKVGSHAQYKFCSSWRYTQIDKMVLDLNDGVDDLKISKTEVKDEEYEDDD